MLMIIVMHLLKRFARSWLSSPERRRATESFIRNGTRGMPEKARGEDKTLGVHVKKIYITITPSSLI